MDVPVVIMEIATASLALALLLLDLWTPARQKRELGWVAVAVLVLVLAGSGLFDEGQALSAFGGRYVLDGLALFFKRFFLVAAILVLVMSLEYADHFARGVVEYYSLTVLALTGMMLAASARDFSLLFVSLELITISFYVLAAFQRDRILSLEAGVKYLIMGALASAFLVYGIALVYGASGTLSYGRLPEPATGLAQNPLFIAGALLILAGLSFKVAAFPFQAWVPDVYQGAPAPTLAFLAVGSKAAGFVLLLRLFGEAFPVLGANWKPLWMLMAAATIMYGNLCALPQRSLKRLLGFSGIANAGYLLLGMAALSREGYEAMLFYLVAYLFAILAAVMVISRLMDENETDDLGVLAGLHQRSPLLAAILAVAMISLAGIPPVAGFFGKFLLLKAVVAKGAADPWYYWLTAIALVGIVISLYYYFGVIRAMYWTRPANEPVAPPVVSRTTRVMLYLCLAGMLIPGILPSWLMHWTTQAIAFMP